MDNAALDAEIIQFDQSAGERMAKELERVLSRFISYPSEHCRAAHALWIMHTHVVDRFDTTPRLAFLSPEPASGKSRALEITERLVPNPVPTVNVSPAYIFRKVGAGDATILFDEIDTVFGPKAKENEEIRGLLNAGHRRGAVAGRCVIKGKEIETEEISAFAPVALAGLGWLPDTIMSRAVIIRMQRRSAAEVVEPYRRRINDVETDRVRNLIEVWSRTFWSDGQVWPELPAEIVDRDADVWEPLIAIADALGGTWPTRARAAAVALVAAAREREPSLGVRLLADLRLILGDRDQVPSAAILEGLHAIEEAPWGNIRGKPLDSRGLAQRLLQYGIRPKTIRVGPATPKGYVRSDFSEAWSRYLPPSPDKWATSATAATPAPSPISVSDVADVSHLAGHRGECAECGGDGDTLEVASGGHTVHLHRDCIDRWEAR